MENRRPDFDPEIQAMCDYVCDYHIDSEEAYETAYYACLDALACAFMALKNNNCTRLLGPMVPGNYLKNGARVPGLPDQFDPVQAAFNFGSMVRWLDFNDTWLAAEWGHPSDNLGAILPVMDYIQRNPELFNQKKFTVRDLLTAMIKAYELQGVMALANAFNQVGLDHVVLVKVATTAIITALFGGTREQIANALSLAWVDGQSLRTYRQAPNTGTRKSWAAGDATARGVRLSLLALAGEMGYPSALTAPIYGFYDASFKGKKFIIERPYTSYVMENILFKIAYPAEFHAQTAVECALFLHEDVKNRFTEISVIHVRTQKSAMRIINKNGPLNNPADRDHCLQYIIAVALIYGNLTAEFYEDKIAKDPRIDILREKMIVTEDPQFTVDYLDPDKRSIANSIKIEFEDGTMTKWASVEYPIGHRQRRREGLPLLMKKFRTSVENHFQPEQADKIFNLIDNKNQFLSLPIDQWVSMLT